MNTVTLPKTEYESLKKQAQAYRKFAASFFELTIDYPIETKNDWLYEPEAVKEILARGKEGREELTSKKTISWQKAKLSA